MIDRTHYCYEPFFGGVTAEVRAVCYRKGEGDWIEYWTRQLGIPFAAFRWGSMSTARVMCSEQAIERHSVTAICGSASMNCRPETSFSNESLDGLLRCGHIR